VTQLTTVHRVDPATPAGADLLERVFSPRDDLVGEADDGGGCFGLREGPFEHYRRSVTTDPATIPADGTVEVTETTEFRLAIPVWRPVFTPLARRALRGTDRVPGRSPWWAPPDRFDPRAARVLALLTVFAMISGYLGTLITQTITFAADEFGAGDRAQGVTLAAVRVGVLLALVLAAAADRRGRRTLLIWITVAACITAATGAAAPDLTWLGASQTVARGLSTAMGLLVAIVAAEELPRNSRAYGVSVLALTAALGSGMAVWALPLADLAVWTWRLLYLIPLAAVPVALAAGRPLPESRRFEQHRDQAPARPRAGRVWLLALSGFLGALFLAPASQFQNEFLRDERGFSATEIAVFTLATNTPGGIGVLVGGWLADVRGRRVVGSISLAVGVALTVLVYLSDGWELWAFSVVAAVIGAATVPALGVYGPELFPTAARGRVNGFITLIAVTGSGVGLLLTGVLSDALGGLGPAIAVLAIGPAALVVLILVAYPETAHRSLEELNPEDR
jgi:MFS family permease